MGDSERDLFSVRIVSIDYYSAPPVPDLDFSYSSFHGGKVNQVPVIRIYGSTPAGQKTCLHVHRVLPYLYIPCSDLGLITNHEAESLKHTICLEVEKSLKFKGNAGSKRQHIHGCDLVRAKKFYGYHSSEELFMKIYFYHPQDISRASNLLLAGAVLEKILQPFESHIPFLLQFLIDYNLYGMGHLHVSKLKFRLPVPDVFSQRKFKYNGDLGSSTCNSTTIELQADSGGSLCSNVPIWTSSTIPDGWSWPYSYHSSEQENPFFRRQSTCELEGDAVVDDIMNQQFISNASLSQTDSKVKMVQSLIPIWKEEYDRSGIFEALPLDSKKPSPQDVLHILSYGVDFEKLVEEKDYAEGCSLLTPEIESSTDRGQMIENSEIDAAVTLQILGSLSPSSVKASDEDALRLLKWLASSQAAEDINSDDELARDTILSPLLPSKNINKVLERASVDYESESQKECQDILDSVDMLSLDELKTRNSSPAENDNQSANKSLSARIIPQLDGSNDDLLLTPCSRSSSETGDGNTELPELDSNAVIKHRNKKPRWGLLPLSSQGMDHALNHNQSRHFDQYRNKKKGPVNSVGSEEGISRNIVTSQGNYSVNHSEEDRVIVECSTRDLMRRKRSQRAELTSCKIPVEDCMAEVHSNVQCEKRDQDCDPISENDITPTKPFVSVVQNYPAENEGMECNQMNTFPTVAMSVEDLNVESTSSRKDCVLTNYPEDVLQVDSVCRDTCGNSGKAYKDDKSSEEIAVTCFEGPLKIGCTDEPIFGTPLLQKTEGNNDTDPEKEELKSGSFGQSVRSSKNNVSQTVIYQKDGSCLFMLTPALSPPSRESVDKWLLFGASSSTVASEREREVSVSPTQESAPSSSVQNDFIQQPERNEGFLDIEVKPLKETKKNQLAGDYSQDTSQISGPEIRTRQTPLSQSGFRDPASIGQGQQMTLLSIEVQAESRGDLSPDPRFDAVNIIVLVFQEDDGSVVDAHVLLRCKSDHVAKNLDAVPGCKIFTCTEELEMFDHFSKVICASDPDVVMGWDVQSGSIGFLAERAAYLGLGLLNNISRTPSKAAVASGDSRASDMEMVKEILSESVGLESVGIESTIIEDEWGRTHASGVHVGGRIVLNVWRLMRNEVRLNMYTIEAVAEAVLRRKVPYIPWKVLREWFSSGPGKARYRSIHYTLERAKLNLQIMDKLDMVNRTSELARVFGIDFFSVLSRGSQYRVESMFLRLAHMQSYLAISPGNQQVANQPAMECLPLVMEPESGFYPDPVVVLDFQSLYPSMVIAYNLCYCTCLGNIAPSKADTLGVVTPYKPNRNILHDLRHRSLVTPNGVVYVPSSVRKGVLPRLLEEILSTRIMVKQAMKRLSSSQTVLHRILNSRQLALKLIANVTYGYTAAGFSGRMPCAELADSIVQCGRRTLETAISFVNTNDKWKARVVYGDTDSMFVLLKGRSLKEAFEIGREIASSITAMNPDPVTLKMEKVYYPCFLLTKKRYVGYSYESADQNKPTFDAKGIETVRRDTCGAVSKIMEQSLRIFFESKDIDKVKPYVLRQWTKILSGRISIQDFVFAKEVRLGTYSEQAHSLPPAAIVAIKSMRLDPRAEPRYAERVPYVVVHGGPGARLVDMVVDPHELVSLNSPFRLNDLYYIRKQIIPALQRVFGLVGSDLNQWFFEMPKSGREAVGKRNVPASDAHYKKRIDYYYLSKKCVLCGELVEGSNHLCQRCCKNKAVAAMVLTGRASKLEKEIHHISAICGNCGGGDWIIVSGVKCRSLACSVFYERVKVQKELQSVSEVATALGYYPKCMVEWF